MKSLTLTAVCLALGLVTVVADESPSGAKSAPKAEEKKTETKPEEKKTVNTKEVAVIKTSEGTMVLELWPDVAPKTVENFKTLANKGFYDGTCFHRVIKDFMIQGGDPLTKDEANQARWGTGDPGYKIKAEFNDKSHTRGVLSMARSNDPDSAGSQFFICHGNPTFLDHKYTAFGKLIKGDEVLEKIATTPTQPGDRPVKRMNVESVKVVPADSVK
jgi:peptidyl-prolyl cis-trans isomerase B (cyclophilin B)